MAVLINIFYNMQWQTIFVVAFFSIQCQHDGNTATICIFMIRLLK